MTLQEDYWLKRLGDVQVGDRVRYTAPQPDPKRQSEHGTVVEVHRPHHVVVHWDSFSDGAANECDPGLCEAIPVRRRQEPTQVDASRSSEIACAVADAFLKIYPDGIPEHEMDEFWNEIYRLEAATSGSSLRKTRR